MTKRDFLESLGKTLRRSLSEGEVADNLRYYDDYISHETGKGRSEDEVLRELGDPRLIAMTILQVDQQKERRGAEPYTSERTVYTESDGSYGAGSQGEPQDSFHGRVKIRSFQAKGWLVLILILVIVLVILGTVFAILWRLLPFLLLAAGILWLYRRLS